MHISWEQLQTMEALVRTGSVEAAARELGLRHSSVSRRIAAMERDLGTPLFLRGARLVPTELGAQICARASRMRAHVQDIEAQLSVHQRAREGRIVVTTNDALAPLLFKALARAEIQAKIEVTVSDHVRELAPGVVDLALRPTHEPGDTLRGHRLGMLRLGVYRAEGGSRSWVLPATSLREKTSMRWWRLIPADAPGGLECDSFIAMRDACVAGLGRAVLPAFWATGDKRLRLEEEVQMGTPVWLLSPSTRQRDSGLRQIRENMSQALRSIEGAWITTLRTPREVAGGSQRYP